MEDDFSLKDRFFALCRRLGLRNAQYAYDLMEKYYCRQGRYYTNLNHIRECLVEFDQAKELSRNPDTLEFAIFYHDIFFDASFNSNQERSSRLAYHICIGNGVPTDQVWEISDLILATKGNAYSINIDEELLVDIDNSIFGKEPEKFDEYENNFRTECLKYTHTYSYNANRAGLLKKILDRPSIYLTTFFQEKYEEKARENLKRLSESLESNNKD